MDRRVGYPNKRAQTRQRLLQAGLGAVARHGVTATTIGDIAACAGVSPATFYNHFSTKDDLLAALVDDLTATVEHSAARIRVSQDDPAGRISLAIMSLLARAYSEPDFRDAFLEFASHDPRLRTQLRSFIADTIADGVRQERFSVTADPEIIDAVLGIALEAVRAHKHDQDRNPARVADLLLRLLGVQAPDSESVLSNVTRHAGKRTSDVAIAP